MSTILDLQNIITTVNVGTNEEKQILKNINLKLEDGDFVTLLGTNGAGKSTLLNIINGSITPTSGKIILKNRDLTNLSEVKRAKYIAQVFQDPKMGTAPRMTVAENLLLATKRGQRRGLHEHTAALDPNTSRELLELTNKVVHEEKLTCIMITHQLRDAIKYGNRTIILNSGQIVLDVKGEEKKKLTEEDILQYFTD